MNVIFRIQAATPAAAKAAVAARLAVEVAQQPNRQHDAQQVQTVADAYIDLIDADPSKDVAVVVNATLLGDWTGPAMTAVRSANVTIGVGLVDRAE